MELPLEQIILQQIQKIGPISVSEFIETALYHPRHGYYLQQSVFGAGGDYITAPEISQLFGEMIAVKFLSYLQSINFNGSGVTIIELGPGRGTLMGDILRVFKQHTKLIGKLTIYLVEISNNLQQVQREQLSDYPVIWTNNINDIANFAENDSQGNCHLIVANEFFDALPVEQYLKIDGKHHKRRVGIINHKLNFADKDSATHSAVTGLPDIYQHCPSYYVYIDFINKMLNKNPGLAIIVDYGDCVPLGQPHGNTLQSLYRHQYADIFANIGLQDITHAVDFNQLRYLVAPPLKTTFMKQGEFLLELGLAQRLKILCNNAISAEQVSDLGSGALRLISEREMGQLFKVLLIEST